MSDFPRRSQMQKWCEAEHKIADAMQAVEMMGADIRLTDAVCLLSAARDRVADFVDGVEGKRTMPRDISTRAALPAEHAPPEPSDDNSRATLDDIWKRRSSEWCKHIEWDDPDLERAVAIAERALTTLRGSRPALAGRGDQKPKKWQTQERGDFWIVWNDQDVEEVCANSEADAFRMRDALNAARSGNQGAKP